MRRPMKLLLNDAYVIVARRRVRGEERVRGPGRTGGRAYIHRPPRQRDVGRDRQGVKIGFRIEVLI